MSDVYDIVVLGTCGPEGWWGPAQIHDIAIDFHRCLWQAIIGARLEKKRELDVPLDLFDKECKILVDNYEPLDDNQPKDASQIVNRFKKAFHTWYAYRKSIASGLKDKKFKRAYESITYSFARKYFLHLKNRFDDIGLMNMDTPCLKNDCSNQELLDFNYEISYKEFYKF